MIHFVEVKSSVDEPAQIKLRGRLDEVESQKCPFSHSRDSKKSIIVGQLSGRRRLREEASPGEGVVVISKGGVKIAMGGGRGGGINKVLRVRRIRLAKQGNRFLLVGTTHPSAVDGRGLHEGLIQGQTSLRIPTSQKPQMLSAGHRSSKWHHIIEIDIDRVD